MYKGMTQKEFVIEFFKNNPNRNIKHPEVVNWLTKEWLVRTDEVFRNPDRAIRMLAQDGFLQKISKGIYRYDPKYVVQRKLKDFTQVQKEEIIKRDNYRCVMCGNGLAEGIELHVGYIKPKDFGGKAVIENGQTLCAQHNFEKKTHTQTETGKKMFIRLYELSKSLGDNETKNFCSEILEVFEKNGVNGHIVWKR